MSGAAARGADGGASSGRGREPAGASCPRAGAGRDCPRRVRRAVPCGWARPDLRANRRFCWPHLTAPLNVCWPVIGANFLGARRGARQPDLHNGRFCPRAGLVAAALPGLRGLLDDDVMAFHRPGRAQRGRSAANATPASGRAASPPGPSAISDGATSGADDCRAGACAATGIRFTPRADWLDSLLITALA